MNAKNDPIVVLITSDSEDEAAAIARMLVEKRLAACVNSINEVRSLYWWQGKIDSAHETLLIVKSRISLLAKLTEAVKKAHSYSVPEIIALPIIGGNRDYLEWLDRETQSPSAHEDPS